MVELQFPNISHKPAFLALQEKWKSYEVSPQSTAIFRYETYEEFLDIKTQDLEWRPWFVPATFFFLVNEDNEIVGHIQIRHHIDHPNLRDFWGHIGYAIVPWEWWKWYGKKQLELALLEAKKLWLSELLITCSPDNIASEKIIVANGWVWKEDVILQEAPSDRQDMIWKTIKKFIITI